MFKLDQAIKYWGKILPIVVIFALAILLSSSLAVMLSGKWETRAFVPVIVSLLLAIASLILIQHVGARFIKSMYDLKSLSEARKFLGYRILGRMGFPPYLIIREGNIAFGSDIVRNIGGPGGLVVYNDTAVVLERAGQFTRVVRGPGFPHLEPFEKIWDVIDLRPQRWVFEVSAITHDGIPIDYEADVQFQIGDTDADIFKAATCKWVRDAWRSEPDRLMIWTKRLIISATEGGLRAILARYSLDQLLDSGYRATVRDELNKRLNNAAPGMGVKILNVALGDIKLRGRVVQQWLETWRAERVHEMERVVLEGKAERARILEKARAEVRKKLLNQTVEVFTEMADRDQKLSVNLVTLSFIEMLKRISFEQNLYSPDEMIKTLDLLQQSAETGKLEQAN